MSLIYVGSTVYYSRGQVNAGQSSGSICKIVPVIFLLPRTPVLLTPGCARGSLLNSQTHTVYIDYITEFNEIDVILRFV